VAAPAGDPPGVICGVRGGGLGAGAAVVETGEAGASGRSRVDSVVGPARLRKGRQGRGGVRAGSKSSAVVKQMHSTIAAGVRGATAPHS
jgi:hypothetical protein